MTTAMFTLREASRTYRQQQREVRALRPTNLDIMRGEFATIQGPTGGGKSTLLQLLGTLDRPTAGEVILDGTDVGKASNRELSAVRADKVGFVFQAFNLIPTLTARENVDMALEPLPQTKAERNLQVSEALERVGLAERADHFPSELSGGQQQRVAIARAIVKRPTVLLADEPTGNLDEAMRDEILDVLQALHADGLTLVVVTHDSAVARRATRQLRLQDGVVKDITRK